MLESCAWLAMTPLSIRAVHPEMRRSLSLPKQSSLLAASCARATAAAHTIIRASVAINPALRFILVLPPANHQDVGAPGRKASPQSKPISNTMPPCAAICGKGVISSCERSLLHDGAANMASAAGAGPPARFVADCG